MGRDTGPILEEIRQLKEDRDSWRRVSERLESEKNDVVSHLRIAEQTLYKYSSMIVLDSEDHPHDVGMIAREALEKINTMRRK